MTDKIINKKDKDSELAKYRDLVNVTIDYYLETNSMKIKTIDFDSDDHYRKLQIEANEHFQKGRLTRLKQWFSDLTEPLIETCDIDFNRYIKEKTNFNIDLTKSYIDNVEKLIKKGKITNNHQFYDLSILVNKLCQIEPIDQEKIEAINTLLADYELKKQKNHKPS